MSQDSDNFLPDVLWSSVYAPQSSDFKNDITTVPFGRAELLIGARDALFCMCLRRHGPRTLVFTAVLTAWILCYLDSAMRYDEQTSNMRHCE